MRKYTATITCNRALWDKFKDWATKRGSSASEQISKFMECCVQNGANTEDKAYIDHVIEERIQAFVDERLNDLIDYRFIHHCKYPEPEVFLSKKSSLPQEREDTDDTEYTEEREQENLFSPNEDLIDELDSSLKELEKKAANAQLEDMDTEDTEDTEPTTPETSFSGKVGKYDQVDYYEGRRIYSDKEVSQMENVSKSTLSRYRNRKSKPRNPEFRLRWETTPDRKGWLRT